MAVFRFNDEKEEKKVTLTDDYIRAVKWMVDKFPEKFGDGHHCVRVAILRLYKELREEAEKDETKKRGDGSSGVLASATPLRDASWDGWSGPRI